jgi:16S rRNA (guanine527-N7)-methyltransferase
MLASERRLLAREASRLGCSIDVEQMERLEAYGEILRTWNDRIRLLGDRDPAMLVRKHLPDCLALISYLPVEGLLADIGTGPGLPGLVLACMRPDLECWLIEARQRRLSFLYEAKARIGLERVRIMASRAEEITGRSEFARRASLVTARAVPVDDLIAYGLPLLRVGGCILVMQSQKGSIDQFRKRMSLEGLQVSSIKEYRLIDGEARRIVALEVA